MIPLTCVTRSNFDSIKETGQRSTTRATLHFLDFNHNCSISRNERATRKGDRTATFVKPKYGRQKFLVSKETCEFLDLVKNQERTVVLYERIIVSVTQKTSLVTVKPA